MMFISTNPGCRAASAGRSTSPTTTDELVQIFVRLGERHEYHAGDDAIEALGWSSRRSLVIRLGNAGSCATSSRPQ